MDACMICLSCCGLGWVGFGWFADPPLAHTRPPHQNKQGYGTCKKSEDCAPGGTCNTRKRACTCQEGWTGPHCKQRQYADDDARGPIRLPVYALQPPTSLSVLIALLAGALVAGVMLVVQQRRQEASASANSNAGAEMYQPIASG